MSATSRLGLQIQEIVAALESSEINFALIGGLALAMHGVVRATTDVDLLLAAAGAERVDRIMNGLDYRCLYRSDDAGNYLRDRERANFLYARRPIALGLLTSAVGRETPLGWLPVVSAEGLLGFKLQALVNDSRRAQDLADIKALLRARHATMDIDEVRKYFRLFGRENELNGILREIA